MAEIKIEKKKVVWPWVLLAIILLAIIFYYAYDKDEVVTTNDVEKIDQNEETSLNNLALGDATITSINEYNAFVNDESKMDVDHEYSNEALLKLINTTDEVAYDLDVNITADLDAAKDKANYITEDPEKINHADKIKNAGTIITRALAKIQTQKFPELSSEMATVQAAVMDINIDEETLDQKNDVKTFFKKAGMLLTKMKK